MTYTYFIQGESGGPIKIGKANDCQSRLRELQIGSARKLRLLGALPENCESRLHKQFASLRMRGEWFHADEKLVAYVRQMFGALVFEGDENIPLSSVVLTSTEATGAEWIPSVELHRWTKKFLRETWPESPHAHPFREQTHYQDCDECKPCGLRIGLEIARFATGGIDGILYRSKHLMIVCPRPDSKAERQSLMAKINGECVPSVARAQLGLSVLYYDHFGRAYDPALDDRRGVSAFFPLSPPLQRRCPLSATALVTEEA